MDNSSNQKEVEEYLRGVGLTVPEAVVRQVVKVVSEEVKSSFHKLYAGNKRKGVLPLCGKGTVTKIRNLCQEGRLQRYLDYLGAKPGVGQQPSLQSEAAGTPDTAQDGLRRDGQANNPAQTHQDVSALGINTRALLIREWLSRLVELLEIHCSGDLIILSDQVDSGYIRWLRELSDLLASPGLEDLQEAFPELPSSLHSLGEDADVAWEYELRQSLNSYKGRVLEFCVDLGASTDEKLIAAIREQLKPTDTFIRDFRRHKTQIERKF